MKGQESKHTHIHTDSERYCLKHNAKSVRGQTKAYGTTDIFPRTPVFGSFVPFPKSINKLMNTLDALPPYGYSTNLVVGD